MEERKGRRRRSEGRERRQRRKEEERSRSRRRTGEKSRTRKGEADGGREWRWSRERRKRRAVEGGRMAGGGKRTVVYTQDRTLTWIFFFLS